MKEYKHKVDSGMILDWIDSYVTELAYAVDDLEQCVYSEDPTEVMSEADMVDMEVAVKLSILNELRELLLDEGSAVLH